MIQLPESSIVEIPFRHTVIDDFYSGKLDYEASNWHQYWSPLEKKWASNTFSGALKQFARELQGEDFVDQIRRRFGLKDLYPDYNLNGAGIHCIHPGGKLDIHLDHNRNKNIEGYRRINLIYWIHKVEWQEAWGGHLELWSAEDGRPKECVRRILPSANRMVLFECSGISFHGHPEPLKGHARRVSLALYYFSSEEVEDYERYRAHFFPRPSDPYSPELDRLREERSR